MLLPLSWDRCFRTRAWADGAHMYNVHMSYSCSTLSVRFGTWSSLLHLFFSVQLLVLRWPVVAKEFAFIQWWINLNREIHCIGAVAVSQVWTSLPWWRPWSQNWALDGWNREKNWREKILDESDFFEKICVNLISHKCQQESCCISTSIFSPTWDQRCTRHHRKQTSSTASASGGGGGGACDGRHAYIFRVQQLCASSPQRSCVLDRRSLVSLQPCLWLVGSFGCGCVWEDVCCKWVRCMYCMYMLFKKMYYHVNRACLLVLCCMRLVVCDLSASILY